MQTETKVVEKTTLSWRGNLIGPRGARQGSEAGHSILYRSKKGRVVENEGEAADAHMYSETRCDELLERTVTAIVHGPSYFDLSSEGCK